MVRSHPFTSAAANFFGRGNGPFFVRDGGPPTFYRFILNDRGADRDSRTVRIRRLFTYFTCGFRGGPRVYVFRASILLSVGVGPGPTGWRDDTRTTCKVLSLSISSFGVYRLQALQLSFGPDFLTGYSPLVPIEPVATQASPRMKSSRSSTFFGRTKFGVFGAMSLSVAVSVCCVCSNEGSFPV